MSQFSEDFEEPSITITEDNAHMGGLNACGRAGCIHCDKAHRLEKGAVLRAIFEAMLALGHTAIFATLTSSNAGKFLREQLSANQAAWAALMSKKFRAYLTKKYGYIGFIKAVETTHRIDLWKHHPHLHIALIFDRTLDDGQLSELREDITGRWSQHASEVGLTAYRDVQDVRRTYDESGLGKYLAKGMAYELSGASTKIGEKKGKKKKRKKSPSVPFLGLVALAHAAPKGSERREKIVSFYRDAEAALKSRRLIDTSKGLYERYGGKEALQERGAALLAAEAEAPPEPVEVIRLTLPVVHAILRRGWRAHVELAVFRTPEFRQVLARMAAWADGAPLGSFAVEDMLAIVLARERAGWSNGWPELGARAPLSLVPPDD